MYQNPVLLPEYTNRESFSMQFELFDRLSNSLIDLTGCTFEFEIRRPSPPTSFSSVGTPPYYDSWDASYAPALVAGAANITIIDIGVVQIDFTRDDMRTLSRGTYDVGMTVTLGAETRQLFRGRLPIFDGFVTT